MWIPTCREYWRVLQITDWSGLDNEPDMHTVTCLLCCLLSKMIADMLFCVDSERSFHEAGFDAFCVGFSKYCWHATLYIMLCTCNYGKWIYFSAVFLRIAHLVAMRGIK